MAPLLPQAESLIVAPLLPQARPAQSMFAEYFQFLAGAPLPQAHRLGKEIANALLPQAHCLRMAAAASRRRTRHRTTLLPADAGAHELRKRSF